MVSRLSWLVKRIAPKVQQQSTRSSPSTRAPAPRPAPVRSPSNGVSRFEPASRRAPVALNPLRPGAFFSRASAAAAPGIASSQPPRTATEARARRYELVGQAGRAEQSVASLEQLNRNMPTGAMRAELDSARNEVTRLYREAGQVAARELDFFARGGASPTAIEAYARSVRTSTENAAFAAGMVSGPDASGNQARAEAAAQRVERTFVESGPQAAAAELNRATAEVSAEEALAIVTAAGPTVDRIIDGLGEVARAADGDQFSPLGGGQEARAAFDRTVADLSAATSRAGAAPGGQRELERVAGRIATAIRQGGIGRFDEALGSTVLGGHPYDPATDPANSSSALAVEVMRQLSEAGESGIANDILQNVAAATDKLNQGLQGLTEQVEERNQDLARLLQDWAPLMNEEEQAAAIAAFRDSHPEYAQLDAITGPAMRTLDGLHTLPPAVARLDRAGELSGRLDQFIEHAPAAIAQSESGQEELSRLLESSGEGGRANLLDRIANVAGQVKDPTKYLEKVGSLMLNTTVSSALAASTAGDLAGVERALGALRVQGPVFGLGPGQMEDITESLQAAATAQTQDAAEQALTRLDRSLQNLEAEGVFSRQGGFGQVFRAAGVLMGAIATVDSLQEAIRDPNFENVVRTLGSAAGTGQAGIQLVGNMTRNLALLEGGAAGALKFAGNAASVLQAGFSTYQAAEAFADGDPAKGALLAAQAAGAIAALAGSGGVGVVLVVGAGLALSQLEKVRASNQFENAHTEAFLQAAGFDSELTRHLRNADDGGRSVGPVFNALALHLGVEPREFFQAMQSLSPRDLLKLVEASHGVDPNDEGQFAPTAPNDEVVGRGGFAGSPYSLTGLENFLRVNGMELPGV